MRSIILDSGPIITLSLNNLLWLLEKVKSKYNLNFYITESVKREVIDNPLTTKKFKYEALQVMQLIKKKVLEVIQDTAMDEKAYYLLKRANASFKVKEQYLHLVHEAEMSVVAAAILYNADAVMIDERTTRYLIEKPDKLRNVLCHKLHVRVDADKQQIFELRKETKNVKFIRSAEFVAIAFEKGLLDEYIPEGIEGQKTLLDGLMWGLKLSGCAISTRDLEILMREELKIIQ